MPIQKKFLDLIACVYNAPDMIFWSGHGILIPVFGIIGMIFGSIVGVFLGGDRIGPGLSLVLGGLFSGGLIWLYALTFGKTQVNVLLDPNTGKEVRVRRTNTFFFIPALPWAIISTIGAACLVGAGIVTMMAPAPTPDEEIPGAVELSAAEGLIQSDTKGVAHGNTPEAKEMAESFSKATEALRGILIEEGKSSKLSMSGGNFLTYCQVSSHGTAFLVHVPGLRKFTDGAKEVMTEAAWFAANQAVSGMDPAPPKLAVAVKGVILYETIMVGVPSEDLESDPSSGIQKRYPSHEAEVLRAFFAESNVISTNPGEGEELENSSARASSDEPEKSDEPVAESSPAPVKPGNDPDSHTPTSETETKEEKAPVSENQMQMTLPTEVREWASVDGRKLRASLIRFPDSTGSSAEFKREDGQLFTISLEKFSSETQGELQEIFQSLPKP